MFVRETRVYGGNVFFERLLIVVFALFAHLRTAADVVAQIVFAYNLKSVEGVKKPVPRHIDQTPSNGGRTHLEDITTFGLAYKRLGRHLHSHGVAVRSEIRCRATKKSNTRPRARRSTSAMTTGRIERALKIVRKSKHNVVDGGTTRVPRAFDQSR